MLRYPEDSPAAVFVPVNTALYGKDALFRVCYAFTDDYFVFAEPGDGDVVNVYLTPKKGEVAASQVAGEFANALIDEKVRRDIAAETRVIRELIIAEAFAEGNLLDRSGVEADYLDDPRGIAG